MRTLLRLSSATAVAAFVGLTATGCILPPDAGGTDMPCAALHPRCSIEQVLEIERAEASQSQAIPDFDTTTYLIDDPAELDRLEAIITDAGVVGDYRSSGESCPGSITTDVAYSTAEATHTITIGTCSPSAFDEAVTELVSEWRRSGAFPAAP